MDPLSVTASIIAITQVLGAGWGLYASLKGAREDADKLRHEIESIGDLVTHVADRIELNGDQFALTKLQDALERCHTELEKLKDRLEGRKHLKLFRRLPLSNDEISKAVQCLGNSKSSITLALNIGQTGLLWKIDRRAFLDRIPVVRAALYKSYDDRFESKCLSGTRTKLLSEIAQWADAVQGPPIFWVRGIAGAGKSTISRTVAGNCERKHQLAASFFFKKGEEGRGEAREFFPTLASQLASRFPSMLRNIQQVIEENSQIPYLDLESQFTDLIYKPLSQLQSSQSSLNSTNILIIDALDECDNEADQQAIISLLGRLKEITPVRMRTFLTSRPEQSIEFGFGELSQGIYQDVVLHDSPDNDHDITVFLKNELSKIQRNRFLPPRWPDDNVIQELTQLAAPLFIIAAIFCRFIGDRNRDPRKQVEILLQPHKSTQVPSLGRIYPQILDRLTVDQGSESNTQGILVVDFRELVGTIIILASPLSIISLAFLLSKDREAVYCTLRPLSSVLDIPKDPNVETPVRIFHSSFRDFLLGEDLKNKSQYHQFWINEIEAHKSLASRCIEVMEGNLKQNICNLPDYGIPKSEISRDLGAFLPPGLQYACRHWIDHLIQGGDQLIDDSRMHKFLQQHLLHWLEAMSLIDSMPKAVNMVTAIHSRIKTDVDESIDISKLIRDAERFVRQNQNLINVAPLQLYVSAIMFSPAQSLIRQLWNPKDMIPWVSRLPKVQDGWGAFLQTLEGYMVNVVAFSRDGRLLITAHADGTIWFWSMGSMALCYKIEAHESLVHALVLSHKTGVLVSASRDQTLKMWDATTDVITPLRTFRGHKGAVLDVAYSPDDKALASASTDQTVILWCIDGESRKELCGHEHQVTAVAFAPNGKILASGSKDGTIILWNVDVKKVTGAQFRKLSGHLSWISGIAFSLGGEILASASDDTTVRLWDVDAGIPRRILEARGGSVQSITFSPDSRILALASNNGKITLWDLVEHADSTPLQTLEGHRDSVVSVAFSPNGRILASSSTDRTTTLWDATWKTPVHNRDGHTDQVRAVEFSPDGKTLASASNDRTVILWDVDDGTPQRKLTGHQSWVIAVAFSTCGKLLASASDDRTIRVWTIAPETPPRAPQVLNVRDYEVRAMAFSPNCDVLALASNDQPVRLWSMVANVQLRRLEGHARLVDILGFSPGGEILIAASQDETIWLWESITGELLKTFKLDEMETALSFSDDALKQGNGCSLEAPKD
ncbi:Vegetative incompatibility protein [Drechslerella dactyloides]|uniref:Vegetative incompatibility protein n=1 Tax=Drechslerella dactyloides TaxID=74499 RepID=A0AAD6IT40_DREDA|nr:Vegetative incompatibility protein [Drechslerella dactyloides]